MPNYRVSFKKATDDVSGQNDLLYKLFISSQDNLNDPETIESNGTKLTQEYNIDEFIVDITTTDSVYLNVSVEDGAGNRSLYNRVFLQGSTGQDEEPPSLPNNILNVKNISYKSFDVIFNRALDNETPQSELVYSLFKSFTNNLTSVLTIESNGTLVDKKINTNRFTITGLEFLETVWFAVIVEDNAGNKNFYSQNSATTLPEPEDIETTFSSTLNPVPAISYLIESGIINVEFISNVNLTKAIKIITVRNEKLLDFVSLFPKYEVILIDGKRLNENVLFTSDYESRYIEPFTSEFTSEFL